MNETESNQSKGGNARAESLTPDERKAIAANAAKTRWDAIKRRNDPARIPEALCEGELEIGAVTIECYVLDNFKRVIQV